MPRTWAAAVIAGSAVLVSGCSTATGKDTTPPPSLSVPTSTSTPTSKTSSALPEAVTAACPLLPADEVKRILGGGNGTALQAKEDKPKGDVYTCRYQHGGTEALSLVVRTMPAAGRTPAAVIDAIAENSDAKAHRVDGVGDAAVFYQTADGAAVLAMAKQAAGGLRTVVLAGPKVVPENKFTELGKVVVDRV